MKIVVTVLNHREQYTFEYEAKEAPQKDVVIFVSGRNFKVKERRDVLSEVEGKFKLDLIAVDVEEVTCA